ncbi:MAG TPA: transketolase [Elusimicrobia bacterium]|nr:transketolase [Elusimicrobiota bacterium]
MEKTDSTIRFLREKALWVRKETLKIHGIAQETRVASSLSPVEIFVALFYGGIIKYDPKNLKWEGRDRFIVSKGHGSISFYPILADLGYFDKENLLKVSKEGSFLGGIPDPIIPGYETVNGSLGHGLGVACGMALALKRKNRMEKIFVLMGDGELYEGSVWEAIMLAGEHGLDNLVLIIDHNKACMLDFCKNIINLDPLGEKFKVFKWSVSAVDGHDMEQTYKALLRFKSEEKGMPKVLIASTVKGKGVPSLEVDPLSHIKNISPGAIDAAIEGLQ